MMTPTSPTSSVPFEPAEIQGNLPRRFTRIAAAFPNRPAVISPGYSFSYQELNQRAIQIAATLQRSFGHTSIPVAILQDYDAVSLATILGVLFSGNIYCVLNPMDPDGRLTAILQDLGAKTLLTSDAHFDRARRISPPDCQPLVLDGDPSEGSSRFLVQDIPAEEYAAIFYTSGTTGAAKGVPRSHQALLHRVWLDYHDLDLLPSDRFILLRSPAFAGSTAPIFDALLSGGALYIHDLNNRDPNSLVSTLLEQKITVVNAPIEYLRHFINICPAGTLFTTVRSMILGGEVLYRKDVENLRPFFPSTLQIHYNLSSSEVGLLARNTFGIGTRLDRDIVPVGHPIAGKEILLLGEDNRPCKPGEPGEITVRTQYRFKEYWGKQDDAQSLFLKDPEHPEMQLYKTGDLGRWDENGQLEFIGRKDFQFKVRGYRISLPVIESCLYGIKDVQQAVVTLRKDPDGEKRIAAYLIPRAGARLAIRHIRDGMSKTLPEYMLPSVFVFMKEFPRTASGKIDLRSLPEPAWSTRQSDEEYLPARNEAERRLVELWQETLGIRKIGVRDDFFILGGDSLSATEILAGIDKSFGVLLPPACFLEDRTIEQMARNLLDWSAELQRIVPIQPHGSRTPLFLFPGHLGDTLYFRFLAQHLNPDQPVYGIELVSPQGNSVSTMDLVETARRCVDEIRALRQNGPYQLAGHSFGGLLAYEIAQQFIAAGEKVSFLGMFDTHTPGYQSRAPWSERIRIHWNNLQAFNHRERVLYIKERVQNLLIKASGNRLLRSLLSGLNLLPQNVSARNRIASRNYLPKTYPGPLTVFKSTEHKDYERGDRTAEWTKYSDRVQIIAVPGDHASMLREPHVADLARELDRILTGVDSLVPGEYNPPTKRE